MGKIKFNASFSCTCYICPVDSYIILFTFRHNKIFWKNTHKKKVLLFIEICLLIFFCISYFLPHVLKLNFYDSSNPFLCGYRDRIRSKLNIKETQNWLKTQFQKYNKDEFYKKTNLHDNVPDCLKPLHSDGSFAFGGDDNDNPTIEQICGATFLDWGLIIEMEDMPFPHAEELKKRGGFWLSVAPGVYVYAE